MSIHIAAEAGEIAPRVLLPGDPLRAKFIAQNFLENVRCYSSVRNRLGFTGRLTRSEIVQILKNLGAISVDMPSQDMLYGELRDAFGISHVLDGDALDVSSIEDGPSMLSKDTVVFVAEERNVQIKFTPYS